VDASGLIGVATNPSVAWLMTTIGGLWLFLFLLRRKDGDPDAWPAGLVLATDASDLASAHPAAVVGRPTDGHAGTAVVEPSAPREARAFAAPPSKGTERVKVGYRRVRLSSKPDAVRSVELGRLERGDEVEILESYEGFLRVRTSDGVTGWIQRHTAVGGSVD